MDASGKSLQRRQIETRRCGESHLPGVSDFAYQVHPSIDPRTASCTGVLVDVDQIHNGQVDCHPARSSMGGGAPQHA